MNPVSHSLFAAALIAAGLGAAQAASTGPYDTFDTNGLDATRWLEPDIDAVRTATGGKAVLGKRSLGSAKADSGGAFDVHALSFANSEALTTIAADVTVDSVVASACEANPLVASSKLRLGGAFFNAGTPVSGSALGDVVAQVVWSRDSNSADAPGQMRLTGAVLRCASADCSNFKVLGSLTDLGLVDPGRKTRITLRWDRTAKAFSFRRDVGLPLAVTYTEDDTQPAAKPTKSFSVRNVAPNCASGDRGEATLKVRIDNVSVNTAALP